MGFCGSQMADTPYLVALALLEVGGKRALPLSGKSLPAAAAEAPDPGDEGRALALELMLRVWQRSDEGPIQRAAGDNSLLLVEMPLELMSEQLPNDLRQVRTSQLAALALIPGIVPIWGLSPCKGNPRMMALHTLVRHAQHQPVQRDHPPGHHLSEVDTGWRAVRRGQVGVALPAQADRSSPGGMAVKV